MRGRVLIVAGSDSGGGAGIQADIKTVTALGGFAATAVTALTAQNTLGVHHIQPVAPAFVEQQMVAVLDDIGADIIKIGMLLDAAMTQHVADVIGARATGAGAPRVVLDPVMVAKGGASLLQDQALSVLREQLIPLAWLVTPNIPEAEALTGITVANPEDMARAGAAIMAMGAENVLIKGGHLEGALLTDLLVTPQGNVSYESTRIDSVHTHGTGCTLASAIATGLAQDSDLAQSVAAARAYVREAIRTAPEYGAGHGPLNHGHPFLGEA